jgi:collagenase-like PrtC family protease
VHSLDAGSAPKLFISARVRPGANLKYEMKASAVSTAAERGKILVAVTAGCKDGGITKSFRFLQNMKPPARGIR